MFHQNTKGDLLALLQYVDTRITSKVVLVSIGGTALTLLGNKDFSYDLDFIIATAENQEEFNDVYERGVVELNLAQGEHPPYTAFDMGLLNINDYLAKSDLVKNQLYEHITLYTMNILDIILSKYFRSLGKDKEDIQLILQKQGISRHALYLRYLGLLRQQDPDIRAPFTQRYNELIRDFGHLFK